MTASFLLLVVGVLDLGRSEGSRRRWVAEVILVAVLVVIGWFCLSMHPLLVVAALLVGIAWRALMPWSGGATPLGPTGHASTPSRLWVVGGLMVAVLAASVADVLLPVGDVPPLRRAYETVTTGASNGVSFDAVMAALAVGFFLTQTSNVVVRAALGPVVLERAVGGEPSRAGRKKKASDAAAATATTATGSRPGLKGGRLIGPLERILILVLAFAGMFTVIAAVIAAKGVVRFPEIANDKGEGSKAEEFLVGTLTSCALAAAGGLYLYAVAR